MVFHKMCILSFIIKLLNQRGKFVTGGKLVIEVQTYLRVAERAGIVAINVNNMMPNTNAMNTQRYGQSDGHGLFMAS